METIIRNPKPKTLNPFSVTGTPYNTEPLVCRCSWKLRQTLASSHLLQQEQSYPREFRCRDLGFRGRDLGSGYKVPLRFSLSGFL